MKCRRGKKFMHGKNEMNLKGTISVSTEVTDTCTTAIERKFCQNSGKQGCLHTWKCINFYGGSGGGEVPKNNKWSRIK